MIIQTVTSPGGIDGWLVEDYAMPTFSVRFAFEGGSSQDPPGKDGLANFVTLMLQNGGGGNSALEYLRRVQEHALRIKFTTSKDWVLGSVEALTDNRDAAAQLLNTLLATRQFGAEALDAVRRRLLSFQLGEARTPAAVASKLWAAATFAGHPYERTISGTNATVRTIAADDIEDYCARVFVRDRLKVVAVGDITAEEFGRFLDEAFGDLPVTASLIPVPRIVPVMGGRLRVADMEVSQSSLVFGLGTVPGYDDPGFVAAEILAHIVGGKGGISRLSEEIRNKRGLACQVRAQIDRFGRMPILRGLTATRNDRVGETLETIRDALQKMSDGLITQTDLENAKSYLLGSYPLRFDAHSKITGELLGQLLVGFGPDFFASRKDEIAAVTLDDLKSMAGPMLDPENLIISIAGSPALQPPRTFEWGGPAAEEPPAR